MKLVYFAHDLADPAVHRRVRMLRAAGDGVGKVEIVPIGFRRLGEPVRAIEGLPAVDLGRTEDARLVRRACTVLRVAALLPRWREAIAGATCLMARNLEMLTLAALAQRRIAPGASLVYECLDVHRLMVSRGLMGAALRRIERGLLRRTALLVVSSPAFLRAYFAKAHGTRLPSCVVLENKVLSIELAPGAQAGGTAHATAALTPPAAPPWRIGWFGNLRCRRSLRLLASLADRLPGRVEVVMRGRPTLDVMPDLDAIAARGRSGLSFLGPYDRQTDLARMYGEVHFTWAMDFYEPDTNSAWLLPNRLYEGGLHGAVPIASRSAETGRWLADRGAGVLLEEPLEETLPAFFAALDERGYAEARAAVARLPRADLVCDAAECAAFVQRLAALSAACSSGAEGRGL